MAAAAIWLATIYLELPAQPSSRHRAIASSSSVGSSSGSSRNENVELVVWPMLGVEDAAVKFMAEQILEAMQADRGSQDDLALLDDFMDTLIERGIISSAIREKNSSKSSSKSGGMRRVRSGIVQNSTWNSSTKTPYATGQYCSQRSPPPVISSASAAPPSSQQTPIPPPPPSESVAKRPRLEDDNS